MILNSNFKINLSLSTISKRQDGYTEIETIMYPIHSQLCDIVEMIESKEFEFSNSGIVVDCPDEKNLCVKAFRLMQDRYNLPNVKLHLHKQIPFGAGLGAGSANATTVLKLCNSLFNIQLDNKKLEELAGELGSDTAFFVNNTPAIARGRGEELTPIEVDLKGYYILFVKPDIGVSTAEAYQGVTLHKSSISPEEALLEPIEKWQEVMYNDFEPSIFRKLPLLAEIKQDIYNHGAIFASMSGSGSTVYGIFKENPSLTFPYFNHLHLIE